MKLAFVDVNYGIMAEPESQRLRHVRNGDVLKTLSNGLQIVRRIKHEWNASLEGRSNDDLVRYTDRVRGSKFLKHWTLEYYVDWLAKRVAELEWDEKTLSQTHTIESSEPVGYSRGKIIGRIRIELSSRCIHAYPVEE